MKQPKKQAKEIDEEDKSCKQKLKKKLKKLEELKPRSQGKATWPLVGLRNLVKKVICSMRMERE